MRWRRDKEPVPVLGVWLCRVVLQGGPSNGMRVDAPRDLPRAIYTPVPGKVSLDAAGCIDRVARYRQTSIMLNGEFPVYAFEDYEFMTTEKAWAEGKGRE